MADQLTPAQRNLTPEELKEDVQLRMAEQILKSIDPSIEIEWVKGDKSADESDVKGFSFTGPAALPGLGRITVAPGGVGGLGFRRIIQFKG